MFSKIQILGVALATLVAVGLVACGGDSGGDKAKLAETCFDCDFLGYDGDGEKCNRNNCKPLLKIYKDECDKGNGESCFKVGEAYLEIPEDSNGCMLGIAAGEGCDVIEAVSRLKKSCDLKYAKGCEQLAFAYRVHIKDMEKAEKADEQALKSYEKECDSGNINSCAEAGKIYVKPSSGYITQNYQKGLTLLQKFCDKFKKGDRGIYSCLTLGGMFAEGKGTLQNYEQAKKYFAMVCEAGVQDGCEAYKKANEKSK